MSDQTATIQKRRQVLVQDAKLHASVGMASSQALFGSLNITLYFRYFLGNLLLSNWHVRFPLLIYKSYEIFQNSQYLI